MTEKTINVHGSLAPRGGRVWQCVDCGTYVTADCPCCEPNEGCACREQRVFVDAVDIEPEQTIECTICGSDVSETEGWCARCEYGVGQERMSL